MSWNRTASHAGTWYTDDGSDLNAQLAGWLEKAAASHTPARAIIAPHAGYSYSGPTAAYAYRQIDASNIKRVFILGPSHHYYLKGCALSASKEYETPLGNLVIDQAVSHELNKNGEFDLMSRKTDEDEHSIEMHLPYVYKILHDAGSSAKIIPVLVGGLSPEREAYYGKIFAPYLRDPSNLFIISSDFCHWGRRFDFTYTNPQFEKIHEAIEDLDRQGMQLIENLNTAGFTSYLQKHHNTICGRHPIGVLLNAIEALADQHPDMKFVHYAQSSQVKSMKDSSVSYASASLICHD